MDQDNLQIGTVKGVVHLISFAQIICNACMWSNVDRQLAYSGDPSNRVLYFCCMYCHSSQLVFVFVFISRKFGHVIVFVFLWKNFQ